MKDLADEHPELAKEIMALMASGNELDERKEDGARAMYQKAWDLLPEPKLGWTPLSAWVTGSFFQLHFDAGDFAAARHWAQQTLEGRESDIDTGPLLNLGMACFELGDTAQAYECFDQAHRLGKARAFQGRPRKYLKFYLDER